MLSLSQALAAEMGAALIGEPGLCFLCGRHSATTKRSAQIPDSFRDYDNGRRQDADCVCAACLWSMAGKPPNTLRMWSVVWCSGGGLPKPSDARAPFSSANVWMGSKGDLRAALEVTLSPPAKPWAVSLADSGKIHIIPYVPVASAATWSIRLERHTIHEDVRRWREVVFKVAALLVAGHSKSAILAGEPHPSVWMKAEAMEAWARHYPTLETCQTSPLLEAAVFLLRDVYAHEFTEETWIPLWSWLRT